jgi:hypothetical protein
MNIEQEREKLKAAAARILDATARAQLEAEFEALAVRHAAAEDKAPIEAEIEQLQQRAAAAADEGGGGNGGAGNGGAGNGGGGNGGGPADPPAVPPAPFLTAGGYWLAVILAVGGVGFAVFYLSLDQYPTIEGTRPLLVLTLIVSMLGFGGLLIVRALFAPMTINGTEFQARFRMAREIFLVFSGIFGTIIGFYFGAADDVPGGAPTVEIAFADGRVTAAVAEGAEPFMGIFTPDGASGGTVMEADGRLLSYTVADGACPAGAAIVVIDGRGRRAEGNVSCDEGEEAADSNNTATENATESPPAEGAENVNTNVQ